MTVKFAVLVTGPEVAVTVTRVEVGRVDGEDPPHPVKRLRPTTLTPSRIIICRRRRFLKPKRQRATANVAPGNRAVLLWTAAAAPPPVTVSTVVAVVVPVVVTLAGEKLQDALPEQANVTGVFNGF
jgi:hypothetical protein